MVSYNSVDDAVQKLRSLPNPAYLFDMDGTLLPIAATPEEVLVPDDLEENINGLSAAFGGAVGIISGRDMAFIDSLFTRRLPASSAHGIFIRRLEGGKSERQVAAPDMRLLQNIISGYFNTHGLSGRGCRIEVKQDTCALHYRASAIQGVETLIERIAKDTLSKYEMEKTPQYPPLDITKGEMVFEIGPAGIDKGSALNILRATPAFSGRAIIYSGDTYADMAAINVLKAGDISIGVGPTLAGKTDLLLASPASLHEVIRRMQSTMRKNYAPE